MATLSRRVQLLLSPEQYKRLEALGRSRGALRRSAHPPGDRSAPGASPANQTAESGSAHCRHVASCGGLGTDGTGIDGSAL